MKTYGLLLFLIPTLLAAQMADREGFEAKNYRVRDIEIENKAARYVKNPLISRIIITDLRSDSTSSGYVYGGISYNYFFDKLAFIRPEEILQYLTGSKESNPQQTAPGYTVHCFLKRLRLSDVLNPEPEEPENKLQTRADASGIVCEADFFLSDQANYYPLFRFDTLITDRKSINRSATSCMLRLLDTMIARLNRAEPDQVKITGRKLLASAVITHYADMIRFPILTGVPKKGIYRNFSSFTMNNPDTTAFDVDYGKKGDFLYTKKADGTQQLETDIWGYCDGQEMYVYSANNFFKLNRTGQTYSIWGAKDFTRVRNIRPNFDTKSLIVGMESNYAKEGTVAKYYLKKRPLQLDMLSGELY